MTARKPAASARPVARAAAAVGPSTSGGEPLNPADSALIDEFCDALWLEDGLAKLTLEAYRRDLAQLARWLAGNCSSCNIYYFI